MMDRVSYHYRGIRYVFVDTAAFGPTRQPGAASLQHASGQEARSVVEAMARDEPALLDRLWRELEGSGAAPQAYVQPRRIGEDPRIERVLQGLGLTSLRAEGDGPPAFAQIHVLREPVSRSPSAPDSPEAAAIDRVLATLEPAGLLFRGHHYRFVRAGQVAAMRERAHYETTSDAEMWSVLQAWADEESAPPAQRKALGELLRIAETQRTRRGRSELLLLRRARLHAPSATSAPAWTPSQLRTARERDWIAVEAVDRDEQPVAGVQLELVLPDGGVTKLSTDGSGVARLASIAPGSVTIRVLERDGESWRALGGAPAAASSQQGPLRTHVVRAGECLTKIASRHGFKGWKTLWEHAQNEALRKRRSNPHVLAPGDVVAIPRPTLHEIVRDTGAVHRIEVARPSALVRLRLQDLAGNPLARLSYHYGFQTEAGKVRRPGSQPTDADGWLEETVPLSVTRLEVELRLPKLRFVHDLRRLHPARDRDTDAPISAGIAQRLAGLGYGDSKSDAGTTTRPGDVSLFQALQLQRGDADGTPDRQTLDALEGAYTV